MAIGHQPANPIRDSGPRPHPKSGCTRAICSLPPSRDESLINGGVHVPTSQITSSFHRCSVLPRTAHRTLFRIPASHRVRRSCSSHHLYEAGTPIKTRGPRSTLYGPEADRSEFGFNKLISSSLKQASPHAHRPSWRGCGDSPNLAAVGCNPFVARTTEGNPPDQLLRSSGNKQSGRSPLNDGLPHGVALVDRKEVQVISRKDFSKAARQASTWLCAIAPQSDSVAATISIVINHQYNSN